MEGILTTPTTRRSLHRPVLLAAAAAVVAAAVVGGMVAAASGGGTRSAGPSTPISAGPHMAFAANVRAVAEANQRLLVNDPNWKITHVDEFTVAEGEVRFENGSKSLDVNWRKAGSTAAYYDDRAHDNAKQPITLLGQQGTMFTYTGDDFTTILPPKARTSGDPRLRRLGAGVPRPDRQAALVDVDTWLAAMPASVVKPADARTTVDAMLAGLPLPPGLDKQRLYSRRRGTATRSAPRSAVRWPADGSTVGGRQALRRRPEAEATTDALATSHGWKVLNDMNPGRLPGGAVGLRGPGRPGAGPGRVQGGPRLLTP